MEATTTAATATHKMSTMDYVYKVSAGVSNAILVCLGIGLLLQSLANFVHWAALYQVGAIAQVLLGPAFGVAIATMLNSNTLVTFSAMISSTIGGRSGRTPSFSRSPQLTASQRRGIRWPKQLRARSLPPVNRFRPLRLG